MKGIWNLRFLCLIQLIVIENMESICRKKEKKGPRVLRKFRFKDLRANASLQLEGKKPNLDAKKVSFRRIRSTVPASTSANANSQFVSIIRPYAISRAVFFLPSDFARLNGLMRRRKMMLRDERQRLWPVQLDEVGPRFAFTKGWRQFREANAVQVGDSYKFELIDNGIIPIAYFRPVRANASFQPEGKKPILDTKRVSTLAYASTRFISTIRPYCIRQNCLYLPFAFAKSNGLVNRRCKMIIRDEKQRPWAVGLAPTGHHIAITRGWLRFREMSKSVILISLNSSTMARYLNYISIVNILGRMPKHQRSH